MGFLGKGEECFMRVLFLHDRGEGREDLVEPWFKLTREKGRRIIKAEVVLKAEHQEFVAKTKGFKALLLGQVHWDIGPQFAAGIFREKTAFERGVVEMTSHPDEFRTKDLEGSRTELLPIPRLRAQHRKALHIAVVENLRDVGRGVREPKIRLVENERSPELVQKVKDG